MFRRVVVCLVAVSAVLAMANSAVTAPVPPLPKGSTVFVAKMNGFDRYFRAATEALGLPLVFVQTRAEADYEVTGVTKEMRPDVEGVSDSRMTRQDTTIWIKKVGSGETVFTHAVRTEVRSPNRSETVHRTTRTRTASRLLATGKETAARRCAQALQNALNETP